jgi:hypothetical protein
VVNLTLRRLGSPITTEWEDEWVTERLLTFWRTENYFTPTGNQTPDHAVHSLCPVETTAFKVRERKVSNLSKVFFLFSFSLYFYFSCPQLRSLSVVFVPRSLPQRTNSTPTLRVCECYCFAPYNCSVRSTPHGNLSAVDNVTKSWRQLRILWQNALWRVASQSHYCV